MDKLLGLHFPDDFPEEDRKRVLEAVRITDTVRLLLWITVVLVFLLLGNLIASVMSTDASNEATQASSQAEHVSNQALVAATEARDELRAAIAKIEQSADQRQATQEAVLKIFAIEELLEQHVTGG